MRGIKSGVGAPKNAKLIHLILIDALHQYSASERLTKEFEKVADDFFSGRLVEAE